MWAKPSMAQPKINKKDKLLATLGVLTLRDCEAQDKKSPKWRIRRFVNQLDNPLGEWSAQEYKEPLGGNTGQGDGE